MSREARRVPLDFDWPTGQVWAGYLLPDTLHEATCTDCDGRGETPARRWVADIASLCLLLDDDIADQERGRPLHPYLAGAANGAYGVRPTPDIVEFGTGLADREGGLLGHDSIDTWRATEKLIVAAGLDPNTWGICATCSGHGSIEKYPGQRAEAEAWEPAPPPTGDGWQLWETTSEGSPQTPVFAAAEELAEYCAREGVSWFGSMTASRERWLSVIRGDSMAMVQVAPGVVIL